MSSFNQLISDLRKGCQRLGYDCRCGNLCENCQAKLDQTLLCEKIANGRLKEEVDFLNELLLIELTDTRYTLPHKKIENRLKHLAELESEVEK
jgi:hypothetical protein